MAWITVTARPELHGRRGRVEAQAVAFSRQSVVRKGDPGGEDVRAAGTMGDDHRRYEVRVTGEVPATALAGLDDIRVARQEMRTVLSGQFTDQAALYGFLNRLRSLGLEVVEVRQIAAGLDPASSPRPARPGADPAPRHDPERSS